MRKLFNFGKKEYQVPQINSVPEGRQEQRNAVLLNDDMRCFRIDIFDHNRPEDLETALGTLELAKDVIKQKLSEWHYKDKMRSGLLVPKGNGKAGLHVQ